MSKIGAKDGMSLSSNFDVQFKFDGADNLMSSYTQDGFVNMLCDEAQLPNVQSAVAQRSGRYLERVRILSSHENFYRFKFRIFDGCSNDAIEILYYMV